MKAASLTSSLLVSKGTARPTLAMEATSPYQEPQNMRHDGGWSRERVSPIAPPIVIPQKSKAPKKAFTPPPKKAGKRFHNSVHLDADTHKKLRLLAARNECSLQNLLETSVQRYLVAESKRLSCICQLNGHADEGSE